MKTTDIAWAAGIFDGEGCVIMATRGSFAARPDKRGYQIRLSVENTDIRMLKKLKRMFQGTIRVHSRKGSCHYSPNRRTCWSWQLYGQAVADFLRTVMPYLIVKREQARLAIRSRKYVILNRRYNPRLVSLQRSIQKELCRLKRRTFIY